MPDRGGHDRLIDTAVAAITLDEDPTAARARARREWWGFMAMSIGAFMAVLDIQIVASSINQIQAGLSASIDEIQWVQTAYLIAEVIAVPLSGYLARLLSTRVYFVISAVGFTLSSLACALAWNLGSMVFFRVLQGFLGGGMIPTSFAAMFLLFPKDRDRALPQLVGGMLTMMAPALGPSVGGYITAFVSWHWLFLINLLPGLVCAWGVWRLVDVDRPRPEMFGLTDWPGLLFMATFLASLEYTLDEGPRHDWFAERSVAITAVLATIGGTLFFWRAFTAAHPIVDLRAFRNRNFALTSMVSSLIGLSMFTLSYVTPVFLGQVRGYNSLQIGEIMMVQGLSMVFAAPIVARLSRRLDPRLVIAIGLVLVAMGSFVNGHLTADWGFGEFLLPQMLRGCGLIFAFIPMTNLALGTLPLSEVNNASGLYTVTRNIGGAVGLALVTTMINERTWLHWQTLAEATRSSREPVRAMLETPHEAASLASNPLLTMARLAQQQAAAMSYADMYLLLSAAVVFALLFVPLLAKPRAAADLVHLE